MSTRAKPRISFTKTGLVCSGGATKAAAFHVGVCLALRDHGFSFVGGAAADPAPMNSVAYPRAIYHPQQIATYVGSSAGALLVSLLAAGVDVESILNTFSEGINFQARGALQQIPRIHYRDMLKIHWPRAAALLRGLRKSSPFGRTWESFILKNLRIPGFFSTQGLAAYLKKNILPTDRFYELKADLFIVGTQLDHSRKTVFGRYGTEKTLDEYVQYVSTATISDAVAASMSLPVIFAPYRIQHDSGKERYYIDGEIRETLSTHVAKENGCDLILCSYTHQPYHYKEEVGSLYDYGIAAIVIQSIYQAIEQKVYGLKKSHENKKVALDVVRKFFQEKSYPESDLNELVARLQEKLDFKENLHYLFIHPEPTDREMFFGEHFTLNATALQDIAAIGYKRAASVLRNYDLVPRAE
jgi:predicted acylesterase/phospholipase RssA